MTTKRKVRWEGLIPLVIWIIGLAMTTSEKYMERLAESTDQLFWVIICSYACIYTVRYIFPKEDNSQTLPTNEETQRNLKKTDKK